MKKLICQNERKYDFKKRETVVCTEPATTTRRSRNTFPPQKVTYDLCAECAEVWDEARREAEWEARHS